MAQIMDEINTVWDSLTQKDQLALAEAIAGKQQAKVFQGLMAGWEDVKKVQKELASGDHFGSALAENAQYVDSISGKLNALKETWVGIFQTIFDDTSIKGLLDGLIAVSEVIANVVSALDKLHLDGPAALAGLFGGFKLIQGLAGKSSSSFIGTMIESMFGLSKATDGVDKSLTKTKKTTGLLSKAWDLVFGTNALKGTKSAAQGVETVAKASKLSVSGLTQMAKGFVTNLSLGAKFGLIGTAIVSIGSALYYASGHLDRQAQKLKESIKTQESEINQLEQKKNSLKSIQQEYDSLNSNQNRTAEESARLLELTKQIAAIMPELVTGYDSAGNPILNLKGDVSDLIAEMERGIDTKKRLLSVEQQELAKNSMQQLKGKWQGSEGKFLDSQGGSGKGKEVNKLLDIEKRYNEELNKLYQNRQNLEDDLMRATGSKREKLVQQLSQYDNEILKTQEKFNTEYVKKWSEIQEHSKNIGEGIFGVLESGYTFDSYSDELKQSFSGLKDALDFSDIDSEDKLYSAQNAIRQLGQAASYGKLDLDQLKKSIENANLEFARSGDIDAYNRSITGLVDQVHSVTGIDKNILTDLFAGLPQALQGAETSLDSFMKAFGKTSFDLQNQSDKVAQAVKNSYDAIQKAIENSTPTGIEELDYKVAIDLSTDQNLPEELRSLINTMLNSGIDSSEVLTIAQKIMIDMSDGEVDIDSWNKFLEDKFDNDNFKISPNILVTPEIEVAQMEAAMAKVEQTYGKIPKEIVTLFKANSITAEADMNRVMAMYELCPEEVITLIETQGSEQAYQTINELMEKYNQVPPEIKTNLKNNGIESASEVVRLNDLYNQLPKEVQTYIKANNYEALSGAKTVQDVLDKIPDQVLTNLTTEVEGEDNALSMHRLLKEFPEETKTKLTVDDSGTQEKLSWWDKLWGKGKEQTATVNVNAQVTGQDQVNNLVSTIASLTGGGGWVGSPSGGKGARTIDQPVDYAMELDANIPMPLASANGGGFGGRGGGGGHTVVINVAVQGLENITSLKNDLNTINAIEVVVGTTTAAKNISGLMVRVREYKTLASSIKAITFSSNTAQSAKNISGLNRRIMEYSQLASSIRPLVFKSETAQSAKNISGLIRKVGEYNSVKPKTLKFQTNASSIAAQINNLARAARSVPNGKTISYNIKQTGHIPKIATKSIASYADGIQAQTLAMQRSIVDGVSPIDNIGQGIMPIDTLSPMARGWSNPLETYNYGLNHFVELENRLKKIISQLEEIDIKSENAFGEEKIEYLRQQSVLLKEQQQVQAQLASEMLKQQQALKDFLAGNGITFDAEENINNYHTKLVAMNRELERLERESENAANNYSNYTGDNEKEKERLSNLSKQASENLSEYKEYYNELKNAIEEYFDLTFDKIPSANNEWQELNNSIKENIDAIEEVAKALREAFNDVDIGKYEGELDATTRKIKILEGQISFLNGQDKINAMREKIQLLRQQQEEAHQLAEAYRRVAAQLRLVLGENGFIFDVNGDIQNLEHLSSFIGTESYEELKEQLEEYKNLHNNVIPDIRDDWANMEVEIDSCTSAVQKLELELKNMSAEITISSLEGALKKVRSAIKEIDREIDRAFGSSKQELIKDKIDLLRKEQDEIDKIIASYRQMAQVYSTYLSNQGFSFGSDGTILNLDHIQSLLNSNNFEAIKDTLEKYIDITQNKIPDLQDDWNSLRGDIADCGDEIARAREELEKFLESAKVDSVLDKFSDLAHEIAKVDKLMEYAFGKDKLKLINQKLELLKQQQIELQKQYEFFNSKKAQLKESLGGLGFSFDSDGNITNYIQQLTNLANSSENFEKVKEMLEEYLELQDDTIPEIVEGWLDIENAYKDALKEQLYTTKEIQDQIKDIYKKQVEERKKLIDEELDKRLDALKKEKDAYNAQREKVDYEKSYLEQLETISEIQKKIDIASKDGSLSGRKKLHELMEQLEEENKKLQDLVQNKIDSDVNDMFDKESDRLEEEADKKKQELDETYSDEKLQEIVDKVLGTGVFEDINGQVHSMQEVMLDYINKYGEGLTAIGTLIKNEMIANLEIAKDTMADLSSILNGLNLSQYYDEIGKAIIPSTISMSDYTGTTSETQVVNFNSPLINIEGSVNEDVIVDLERLEKDLVNKICSKIITGVNGR